MKNKSMRRGMAVLLAAAMLLANISAVFAGSFSDVAEGSWYEEAVEYCLANGLLSGSDGGFAPGGTVTREQCVQALFNLSGAQAGEFKSLFSDVTESDWYADAVVWGSENRIVDGMGEGLFGSGKAVTREQMVTFLYRYAAPEAADTDLSVFADAGQVSSWAEDAVKWAAAKGIVNGKDGADGSKLLAPKSPMKRSELATVMMNFHQLVTEKKLTGKVVSNAANMLKYANIEVNIPADDFLKVFPLGTVVTVDVEGVGTYNLPVCAAYDDVDAGENLLRAAAGKNCVVLATNYGQLAVDAGLVENAPEGSETTFVVKEGVEFPINVTISERKLTGKVVSTAANMLKYANIEINIPADDFLKVFPLGTVVTVDLEGIGSYNLPVCAAYDDVDAGENLLRAAAGKNCVVLATNYGQLAVDAGLVENAPEGSETTFVVKEGVEFPIIATITEKPTSLTGAVIADGADMLKYGHIDIDIPADDFLKVFALGDQVKVALDGYGGYVVPVCASYDDVAAGEALLRAVSGKDYVILAINYGQIALQEDLVEKTPEGSATAYALKEGVQMPIGVTFTLEGSGSAENLIGSLIRTDVREEYAGLTDAQFANFREVKVSGLKDGVLYRSSSPINPEIGRNSFADAAAKSAGVKTFVNLADTEAEATSYPGYKDSYYSAQNHIFLGLPAAFTTGAFQAGLAEGFRFMISNDGPYLVHCTEGKDRAGLTAAILECLVGASYDEVMDDYAITYTNYYSVENGAKRDLTEEELQACKDVIAANLKLAFGTEVGPETDLAAAAAAYMSAIGLSDEETAALKAKLSK